MSDGSARRNEPLAQMETRPHQTGDCTLFIIPNRKAKDETMTSTNTSSDGAYAMNEICSRPECQTTAGCQCGRGYPINAPATTTRPVKGHTLIERLRDLSCCESGC